MEKIALYLRKSREDEENREETLERHNTMLLDYCKRNSLIIVDTFKEIVSGESIANRPEMQKLLDNVANNMYDGVVCIELERLSRGNPVDQCEILDIFKSTNTKIYTLNKVYDLSKEEIDEEYFEFALFMSRREYKTIVRRLQRGKLQATKDGYYTGGMLPFGYTKERINGGWVLVPHPQEAQIVKHIFNMYINGIGTWTIAKYLNEKGIKTRMNKTFMDYTILDMISNKNYIGMIKSTKLNIWVEGKHEGIINPILFERAQEIKSQSTRKKREVKSRNPLATIAKCGLCGYTLRRTTNKNSIEYMGCVRNACKNQSTKLTVLEDIIIDELSKQLKDFNYFVENYGKDNTVIDNSKSELDLLTKELKKKNTMLEKACEMLEQGIYTIDLYKKRTSNLENEIEEIENRINQLNNPVETEDIKIKKAIPILSEVVKNYHNLDPKEKNILLKRIVKRIEYTKLDNNLDINIDLLM